MKHHVLLVAVLGASVAGFAQTGKPCDELKSEIHKKLEANGVKTYTLEVVAKEQSAEGKVVGTCEGGTKKVVYRKAPAPDQAQAKSDQQKVNAGR